MTAVAILAMGKIGYLLAARQAIQSLLAHSDFHIHVTTDAAGRQMLPNSPRVHLHVADISTDYRADLFIGKFVALENCLAHSNDDIAMLLDADAVLVDTIHEADLVGALSDGGLGMAEQPTILGSPMDRKEFLAHYTAYSLAFLMPGAAPPTEAEFRFFNSGVVIGRREAFRDFLDWAAAIRKARPRDHSVGKHMIADQDYFQVWANNVRPGGTLQLPWNWNHCDKWDQGFPRAGARIAHFSNFSKGPEIATINDMRRLAGVAASRGATPSDGGELSIVMVTHNSAEPLAICLEFATALGCRVLVVDNGSSDDSIAICREAGVDLVVNTANLGFGAAANQGLALTDSESVCILNPDCLLTSPVVAAALAVLRHKPDSLIVPEFIDWDGNQQPGRQPAYTATRLIADIFDGHGLALFAEPLHRWAEQGSVAWHWPIGACIFVRRKAFLGLGGFDPKYFCYMEDVQLGRDAQRNGQEILLLPLLVPHFGARGSKIATDRRQKLLNEARLTYAKANYPAPFALGLWLLDRSLAAAHALRRRLRAPIEAAGKP